MARTVVIVASLLALSSALARQPVTSPIYYLTTAPEVREGEPVAGELTPESGRNFKDGSYLDVLVLRGEAGDIVELRASSEWFDTYLTLYATDGTVLASNDDDPAGYGTDSFVRATLPERGSYVVVVSGYGPWDLGPYSVSLARPIGIAPDVGIPSLTQATLELGGRDAYTLNVEGTTVVGIEVRSEWFDTYLEVLDADGWIVADNDDMEGTTDSGVLVRVGPGTYRVVVSSYSPSGSGAYTLTVDRYVRAP